MNSRPINEIDSVKECKNIIRHLELERLENDDMFTFDPIINRDYGKFANIFSRKRIKKIKLVSQLGGVLTGSKVLGKTKLYGYPLIKRTTRKSDWDFLVTKDILYKITKEINFYENGDRLTHRIIESDHYECGEQNLDLMVVDEIPHYYQVKDFKYTDPIYTLDNKLEYILEKERNHSTGYSRLSNEVNVKVDDMKYFYWKFNHLLS